MGRKQFMSDLRAEATTDLQYIDYVVLGGDSEDFLFQFDDGNGIITITAIPTDMASYPADNAYFLSCDKPQYDPALLKLQDTLNGATIREVLTTTSKALQKCNEQLGVNDPYDEQDQSEGDEEESFFMGDHSQGAAVNDNLEDDDSDFRSLNDADAETIDKRIVTDLLRLKSSGYRVGILKGMKARSRNSILSISYRIARLKLGDDVLEAWNLDPSHYIVLLIHYANGYQSLDDVYDAAIQNITVDFRVGTCSRYKPSLGSAIAAFGVARQHFATKGASSATSGGIHATTNSAADDGSVSTESTGAQFSICFISSPMHQLLSASFLSMLKIRVNHQCSWESAKAFLRENAQVNAKDSDYADFNHVMEDISEKTLPSIVLEDHLAPNSCEPGERLSLPLIAMQFTLLYFVRCTEFCLVCHRPVSQNFEALKPYVCDNPLCLYQYMTLGFGPSIEQEILHQPYVVDLLVSFTYSAALDNRLREYPVGMGLTVPTVTTPPIPQKRQRIAGTANFAILSPAPNSTLLQGLVPGTAILAGRVVPVAPLPTTPTDNPFKFAGYGAPLRTHEVKIDLVAGVLTFVSAMESMPALPVKPGTWVMLYVYTGASQDIYHVRVHDCRLPELKFSLTPDQAVLANKISSAVSGERHAIKKPDSNEWYKDFDGHCAIYENNFDDLDDQLKATAICELLHTLPSIHEMVQYLSLSSSSQSSLSTWHDRIPPAALGILRWIVASNRSCIVQVSELKGMGPGIGKSRVEQKLTKIDDYVQFRFAQGAPSKEALFHKALKELGGKEKEIAVCSASSLAAPSANIFGSGAQQGVPNAFSQLGVNVSQKLKNIPPPQYPSQVPLQQTTFSLQAPRPLPILVPPMPLSPQVPPQQAPLSLHALPVPQSQFVDPVVQQELLSAFAEFSRQADSLNTQVADHVSNGGAIATLNTGIVQLQLKVQFDKVNNLIKGMTIKPGHTVVSNTDAKMVRGSAQRLAGAIPTTGAVRMPLGWKPALGASAPNRSAPSSLPLPHSDSSGAMNNRTVGTSSPFTNGPFMQIGTTFLFAGSGIFFLKKRAVCIGAKVKPHPAFPSGGQGGEQVPFFGPLYANPQSQTAAPGTRPTMASASQKPSPAANMAAKMSPAASTAKTAADAAKAGSILGGPNGGPSLFRGPVNSPPLSGAKDLIVTLQKLLASAGIAPAANSNVTQAIGLIPGPKQPTMVFAPPVNAGAGAAPATRTLGSLFKPVTRSQNKRKNPPSPATATAPAPTAEIVKRHPSLFAWHGSGISNWHSIIRQGLDFKETLNGRAFGHGIYHSLDFDTSLGYSHNRGVSRRNNVPSSGPLSCVGTCSSWPNSALGITTAICLNEIVNRPEMFVSSSPHLVVQYPEWIMCRYLIVACDPAMTYKFVKLKQAERDLAIKQAQKAASADTYKDMVAKTVAGAAAVKPAGPFIQQDPVMRPRRVGSGALQAIQAPAPHENTVYIEIPACAFPANREFLIERSNGATETAAENTERLMKKIGSAVKGGHRKKRKSSSPDDDADRYKSEVSDVEDLAFFSSDAAQDLAKTASQVEAVKKVTPFEPGSLNRASIQPLAAPAYATSATSRRLQTELKNLSKVQDSTPLHELGWYIDTSSITNLYQWIIELHSFPLDLPLGKDMKTACCQSIVLEIRFNAQFPMSPPFVRVVRPRFLPFMDGGGGHVTGGGAICMELLTNNGWNPTITVESILLQIRLAMSSLDPRPARLMSVVAKNGVAEGLKGGRVGWLNNTGRTDYGATEAVEAYERAAKSHGWTVPDMRGAGGAPAAQN